MHNVHLFALGTLLAVLQAAVSIHPSNDWFYDLVLGGYVFLFG